MTLKETWRGSNCDESGERNLILMRNSMYLSYTHLDTGLRAMISDTLKCVFFVFMNFYASEDMRKNIGGLVIDADCFCKFHADIEYEFLEDPKK